MSTLEGVMTLKKETITITKKKINIKKMGYRSIKRTFDIFGSMIGCLLLIPITLILKICFIISGDFEPVIFTQYRIGKDGKKFKFYKYRSMITNADEILEELLKNDEQLAKEYQKNKKLENDPRITKIGNFIRKTSLDELPQLFCVLKGDMSLIGNRPYLLREKEDMGEYYQDIIKTKPGITGYWQVSGRSETTFEERLKLEKYYSNKCNMKLDIKIFFKTFAVVLLKNGAK